MADRLPRPMAENASSGDLTPGISVVIPTTGTRLDFLVEALDCVRNQTRPANEVIVVYNGSDFDRFCAELPGSCGEGATNVRGIPRGGAPQARNYGVLLARHSHVAFLDDDDLWEAEYLEKIQLHLQKSHPDLLVSRLDQINPQGELKPCKQLPAEPKPEDFLSANPGTTCSALVAKRESFLEVGGFNVELPASHDKAFVLEMLLQSKRIEVEPQAQSIIREHAGERISTSRNRLVGTERFFQRYRHLMSFRHVLVNRWKLDCMRFQQQRSPWAFLRMLVLGALVYGYAAIGEPAPGRNGDQ